MPDLIDTLSGWNALEDTTSASNFIVPTQDQINSAFGSEKSISAGTMISAGGDIISGIGSYISGQQEASADEYNANIALMQGQFQTEQIDLQEKSTLATQRAMYARAGVELSGSVLDTALNTATSFELDKQVAMYNAKSAAIMDNYNAKVAKSKGEFGLAEGLFSSGATLAIGAALL